jgi:hypothetical protein
MDQTGVTHSASKTATQREADPRRPDICTLTPHKDRQVAHIQRILMYHMNQLETEVKLIPQFACAWERLQNRLDRMLGNPEPKPTDVSKLKSQSQSEVVIECEPPLDQVAPPTTGS